MKKITGKNVSETREVLKSGIIEGIGGIFELTQIGSSEYAIAVDTDMGVRYVKLNITVADMKGTKTTKPFNLEEKVAEYNEKLETALTKKLTQKVNKN